MKEFAKRHRIPTIVGMCILVILIAAVALGVPVIILLTAPIVFLYLLIFVAVVFIFGVLYSACSSFYEWWVNGE